MYSEAEQYCLIQRMKQRYKIKKSFKKNLNVKLHKGTTYSKLCLAVHTCTYFLLQSN